MSEMTATRIGLATLAGLWLAAAYVLWRTSVPGDLQLLRVDLAAYFTPAQLETRTHHDTVLRWLGIGTIAAQLGVLLALARRRPPVRGHVLVRAAQLGALAALALLFALAAAVCVALARRLRARWWLAAAPVFAALGVAVILAQPLLTPRLAPLNRPRLVAKIRALGRKQGLALHDALLQQMPKPTRQLHAEALGIGTATRVI